MPANASSTAGGADEVYVHSSVELDIVPHVHKLEITSSGSEPSLPTHEQQRQGLVFLVSAFLIWGFYAIYFKLLHEVGSFEILAQRMVWSLPTTLIFLRYRDGNIDFFWEAIKDWRVMRLHMLTAFLISLNGAVYIWGVQNGFIVQTSLGYFLNPLFNVLLGVIILKERLRKIQWFATFVAFSGVTYLVIKGGIGAVWIAVGLASLFAVYGLIRKTHPSPAVEGLCLEALINCVPATCYLIYLASIGDFNYAASPAALILCTFLGPVTVIPLGLYHAGAKHIAYSTVGMLQYFAPTLQFLVGTVIYKEDFDSDSLIGYTCVWVACAIFSIEGVYVAKQKQGQPDKT